MNSDFCIYYIIIYNLIKLIETHFWSQNVNGVYFKIAYFINCINSIYNIIEYYIAVN